MDKKPLYDKEIKYDITHLSKELQEMIKKLEEYDETGDWLSYDLLFDELDVRSKALCEAGKISDYDYEKILNKYGWLYD